MTDELPHRFASLSFTTPARPRPGRSSQTSPSKDDLFTPSAVALLPWSVGSPPPPLQRSATHPENVIVSPEHTQAPVFPTVAAGSAIHNRSLHLLREKLGETVFQMLSKKPQHMGKVVVINGSLSQQGIGGGILIASHFFLVSLHVVAAYRAAQLSVVFQAFRKFRAKGKHAYKVNAIHVAGSSVAVQLGLLTGAGSDLPYSS